jgi:hypothetical protein
VPVEKTRGTFQHPGRDDVTVVDIITGVLSCAKSRGAAARRGDGGEDVTGFRPGDDPAQARWAGSIAGDFFTVSGIVGAGFPRYLRLFHPAYLDGLDDGQTGRGATSGRRGGGPLSLS